MEKQISALKDAVKTKTPVLSENVILLGIRHADTYKWRSSSKIVLTTTAVAATLGLVLAANYVFERPGITQITAPLFTMGAAVPGNSVNGYGPMETHPWKYVAGPELSNQPGAGSVYQLRRSGDPEQIIKNLVKIFDVKGTLYKNIDSYQTEEYTFTNGKIPSEPTIGLVWAGTGTWIVDLYEQGRSGESHEFLSDSELKSRALKIFAQTGLKTTAVELEIYKDSGRRVIGYLKVDGLTTPLRWELNWDERGNLQSAVGQSVVAEKRGTFNTISEVDALARIGDSRYFGSVASESINYHRDWKSILKQPKIVTEFVCERASMVSMLVWDKNGDAWLTPGYIFENDKMSWWPSVISLVDGIIELPKRVKETSDY